MKIVVLAGGISTERSVSIVSGTEVCKALRNRGKRPFFWMSIAEKKILCRKMLFRRHMM